MKNLLVAIALIGFLASPGRAATDTPAKWVEPMRRVHQKFTGRPGTLALFGDSITTTLAFWSGLRYEHRNLDAEAEAALDRVNRHMLKECWSDWRGPRFGNDGGKTAAWARENVGAWLRSMNPEVAVILFGTNDLNGTTPDDYDRTMREVVRKCLRNGPVVILTTVPPRSGKLEESRRFAEIVRRIGQEMNVPVIDYFEEILRRRPDDWDGSAKHFSEALKAAGGDVYQAPTLISGDGVHPSYPRKDTGDYSKDALARSGYGLRNYLTLLEYGRVITEVLQPAKK